MHRSCLELDTDQLAGLDERGEYGPVLGAAIGSGEESILAGERQHRDILPMSGRLSPSTIGGILCLVIPFARSTANVAGPVR